MILAERPFVANGHLNRVQMDLDGWSRCTVGAEKIAHMLHGYRESYSFRRVPYQLCYATYVASTILVCNATSSSAVSGHVPSDSVRQLAVCLQGFQEMKVAHPGSALMEEHIRSLMGRLDVSVADPTTIRSGAGCQFLSTVAITWSEKRLIRAVPCRNRRDPALPRQIKVPLEKLLSLA